MKNWTIIVIAIMLLVSLFVNYKLYNTDPIVEVKTITIKVPYDTIIYETKLIESIKTEINIDTIYRDTTYSKTLLTNYFNKNSFEFKYTNKELDLTGIGYVSQNNLDSVKLTGFNISKETNNYSVKNKKQLINYGLGVTAGYGLIHKKFDITVGATMSINF